MKLLTMLPNLIASIIDALVSLTPQLTDGAIDLFTALVEAIPIIIDKLVPQIPKIVNSIIDGLLKLLPKLLEASVKLLMAIVQAIPTIIATLVREIPRIVRTIINTLISRLPDLINGAMGIVQAIPIIIKELIPQIPTIIKSIVQGLVEGIPQVMEVGKDLIKGLWEGIKSMGSFIADKIKGFGKSIVNGFKKIFKINSPSKVFEDVIGKNLALGIGEGFSDEMGSVKKDMLKTMDNFAPDLNVGALAFSNNSTLNQLADLIGSKLGGNVVNNYTIENSFKGMETTKYALHKSNLELKKIIGG